MRTPSMRRRKWFLVRGSNAVMTRILLMLMIVTTTTTTTRDLDLPSPRTILLRSRSWLMKRLSCWLLLWVASFPSMSVSLIMSTLVWTTRVPLWLLSRADWQALRTTLVPLHRWESPWLVMRPRIVFCCWAWLPRWTTFRGDLQRSRWGITLRTDSATCLQWERELLPACSSSSRSELINYAASNFKKI